MTSSEILDVSLSELDTAKFWGSYIDRPNAATQVDATRVDIEGWVLGRISPAVAVEIVHQDAALCRSVMNRRRPELATAYPRVPKGDAR